jgi:hypothetical protein
VSSRPSRPHPLTDVSAADWITERIGEFGSGVAGLVPAGYDAYARLLHPAWPAGEAVADDRELEPLPWKEVAKISGRRMHPRVQFDDLVGTGRGEAREYEPDVGELPPALLFALCEVLAEHTQTPERCWFCLWDGWGWIAGSPSAGVIVTSEAASGRAVDVPPAFPSEIINGPRVSLPGRDYILFEGPLDGANELGWHHGELLSAAYPELDFDPEDFELQSPNLFWPRDRSWFVATEIDLDSTYVGGSQHLVGALLKDPRFEAWPTQLDDRVDAEGDATNG